AGSRSSRWAASWSPRNEGEADRESGRASRRGPGASEARSPRSGRAPDGPPEDINAPPDARARRREALLRGALARLLAAPLRGGALVDRRRQHLPPSVEALAGGVQPAGDQPPRGRDRRGAEAPRRRSGLPGSGEGARRGAPEHHLGRERAED